MNNWILLAQARGLEIPEPELGRIAATLEALEASFRPLAQTLDASVDSASTYIAAPEDAK